MNTSSEVAKTKNMEGVELVVGDCENLPFADNSFDVVICCESFHHYPNPQNFFDSVYRVLRPGGRFILRDMTAKTAPVRWFFNHVEMPIINLTGHGDVHVYGKDEVQKLCENAGLHMEFFEKRGFFRLHCVASKPLENSPRKVNTEKENESKIWDFYAPVYNIFMRQNRSAYEKMYRRIRKMICGKNVLELAAGTGLISRNTASNAESYIATDFSDKMLEQASKGDVSDHLKFMKANAAELPFDDNSFDIVIIANALHIIPEPERVLSEIRRVLKDGGMLIAPNFIHENQSMISHVNSKLLSAAGIAFETKWDKIGYAEFLENNGFHVAKSAVLKASIPLMYTESTMKKGNTNDVRNKNIHRKVDCV